VRSVLAKSLFVLELLTGFSLVVILAGYKRLDRPGSRSNRPRPLG
jgi:hypothetical protein